MKTKILLFAFLGALLSIAACEYNQQSSTSTSTDMLDEATQKIYLQKGQAIAAETFATLAGQLQKSMAKGGVPNAIEYCNLAAFPLVDSLSKVHQATIRRTSLKVRNLKDTATVFEKNILKQYADQEAKGIPLMPLVQQLDDRKLMFCAPIKVNDFCLQCHGKVGETLTQDNYKLIQQYYPNDQATGYEDGDLRGMWSIQFEK